MTAAQRVVKLAREIARAQTEFTDMRVKLILEVHKCRW